MYERRDFFSYILETIVYTYIHLKLFSIIEVKKYCAYIAVPEIEAICNRRTKNGIIFHQNQAVSFTF